MPLRYYFDILSQPSRAIYIFLRVNNVPFEARPVAIRKGEHKSDEYKKINPFGLVPAIEDDNFQLTESTAILKYIIGKFNLPDHWFPKNDLKKQAKIEEYLHWHHSNTRRTAAQLFRQLIITPRATGQPVNQKQVTKLREEVAQMVNNLESYFLKGNSFIGGNEISIADLQSICELTQLYACHEHGLYDKSSVITAWIERVKKETNPHFDEAHKMVVKLHEAYKEISSKL